MDIKILYKPLKITTFDGGRSPYHPSVVVFDFPWNGHKFWMAETPFPPNKKPYTDRWESPSIHVSEDGYKWTEPIGLNNPIDDLSESEIREFDFFSDPHLFSVGNRLECWYRKTCSRGQLKYFSDDSTHILYRKISIDGVHWSERLQLFDLKERFGREMVSPALFFNGLYQLWMVDTKKVNGSFQIVYIESKNCVDWTDVKFCSFSGALCKPWHIDVKFFDGFYWLVVYEFSEKIDLWKSDDGINFTFVKNLLNHNRVFGAFDENGLYRASLVKVSDSDYRLYYSTRGELSTSVGLLKGESLDKMEPVIIKSCILMTFYNLVVILVHKIYRHLRNSNG